MEFANQQTFDLAALARARDGIIDPHRTVVLPGSWICRFADTEQGARQGPWWFEYKRLAEIRDWAADNRLAVPHAARALGAVAHSRGAMRVMVCALVTEPLLAYRGRSKTRFVMKRGRFAEFLGSAASRADAHIDQLYIPGFRDAAICEASTQQLSIEHFAAGTRRTFRMPGIPRLAAHH